MCQLRSFALDGREPTQSFKAGIRYGLVARRRSPRSMRAVRRYRSRNNVQRLEDDMWSANSIRRLEFVAHLAVAQQRQPLFRRRGSCDVAAQALQLLLFVLPGCDTCVAPRPRCSRARTSVQARGSSSNCRSALNTGTRSLSIAATCVSCCSTCSRFLSASPRSPAANLARVRARSM